MAIVVLDHFTDTNGTLLPAHTPDISPNPWVAKAGSYQIQTNRAQVLTAATDAVATIDCGVSDCTISVIVNYTGTPGTTETGIAFRFVDISNFFFATLENTTFKIWELTAGTYTTRANIGITLTFNADHTIQVVLAGPSITATFDGGSQISYSTSVRQTATIHGLESEQVAGANPQWDDFTVTAVTAAGGGGFIPSPGAALPGAVPPRQLKHDHRLMGVFRTGMDERLARRLRRIPWERARLLG